MSQHCGRDTVGRSLCTCGNHLGVDPQRGCEWQSSFLRPFELTDDDLRYSRCAKATRKRLRPSPARVGQVRIRIIRCHRRFFSVANDVNRGRSRWRRIERGLLRGRARRCDCQCDNRCLQIELSCDFVSSHDGLNIFGIECWQENGVKGKWYDTGLRSR